MMTRSQMLALLLVVTGCNRPAAAPAPQSENGPALAPPADNTPVLHVQKVADGDIRVDGKLDEAAWSRCRGTGALGSPMNGAAVPGSRVPADIRVCWSDQRLLVAAVVKDAQPNSPFKREDVDPHLWEQASAVEVMLQPGNPGDNREYFEIQVDTHAAVWDTRFDDYNQPVVQAPDGSRRYGHQDWDAHLERAVTVDAAAGQYVIEMALPWASLTSSRTAVPPKPNDTWRANFYSFRDGQRDSLAWSALLNRGNFHFAPRFGSLVFDAAP